MPQTSEQIIESVGRPQSQLIIMLLAALRELKVARPKKEVLRLIIERKWYATCPEDSRPYPSQRSSTSEPRSHTLIAWARKECVESKLMVKDGIRDSWEATTEGINLIARVKQAIQQGTSSVRPCFFWTLDFKRFIDPNYVASPDDAKRPPYLYEDDLPSWMKSVRGTKLARLVDNLIAEEIGRDAIRQSVERKKQS
jgi:hypothetical protein